MVGLDLGRRVPLRCHRFEFPGNRRQRGGGSHDGHLGVQMLDLRLRPVVLLS
jgi:hypothetical protein